MTLDSTSPAQPWRLVVSVAGRQEISHLDIRLSDASGGAAIDATDNGADLGANTNGRNRSPANASDASNLRLKW